MNLQDIFRRRIVKLLHIDKRIWHLFNRTSRPPPLTNWIWKGIDKVLLPIAIQAPTEVCLIRSTFGFIRFQFDYRDAPKPFICGPALERLITTTTIQHKTKRNLSNVKVFRFSILAKASSYYFVQPADQAAHKAHQTQNTKAINLRSTKRRWFPATFAFWIFH